MVYAKKFSRYFAHPVYAVNNRAAELQEKPESSEESALDWPCAVCEDARIELYSLFVYFGERHCTHA